MTDLPMEFETLLAQARTHRSELNTRETQLRAARTSSNEAEALAGEIAEVNRKLSELMAEFGTLRSSLTYDSPHRAAVYTATEELRELAWGPEEAARFREKLAFESAVRAELDAELELLLDAELLDLFPELVRRAVEAENSARQARNKAEEDKQALWLIDDPDEEDLAGIRAAEEEADRLESIAEETGSAIQDLYLGREVDVRRARRRRAKTTPCTVSITQIDTDPEEYAPSSTLLRYVLIGFVDLPEDGDYFESIDQLLKLVFHLGTPQIVCTLISLDDAIRFKKAAALLGVTVSVAEAPA